MASRPTFDRRANDLPASLDVYYQESGRAGRDDEAADCILLFQRRDRGLQ